MRIGIDGTILLADHLTGVEYSTLQLVRTLSTLNGVHEYVLYFNFNRSRYARRFEERLRPCLSTRMQARICRVPGRLMHIARAHLWLPIDFTLGPCDVIHHPCFVLKPQRWGARVVTFYDMVPLTHPDQYPEQDVEDFRLLVPRAAKEADAIIAISQHTKTEIVSLLAVAPERVTVVHLGVDPMFRPGTPEEVGALRRRLGLTRPYLLFVGTAVSRKNLPRLIEAVARCRGAGLDGVDLVLAGKSAWGSAALRACVDRLGMAEGVHFPGYVSTEDLPALYSGADAFVLPSLAEGFGMPLLEAMACGTPVVASRTTSIPEVVGDAGLLCDPEDVEALADALCRVLTDTTLRNDLVVRGRARAAQFTWEQTARQTLAVYEAVA